MKVRDVIHIVERDGWVFIRQRGSHRHYKHPKKPGVVTIAGHPSLDLSWKTLKSIFKQARLDP